MDIEDVDNAYIGASIRAARTEAPKLELRDLSQRLSDLGYPIGVNSLSKLETDRRKVSAEELIYLAAALEVTPNRLLLGDGSTVPEPEKGDAVRMGDIVRVAGHWEISLFDAWRWVQAEKWPRDRGPSIKLTEIRADRRFRQRSRPHESSETISMEENRELERAGVFDELNTAIQHLREQGVGLDHIRQRIDIMKTLGSIADLQLDESIGRG